MGVDDIQFLNLALKRLAPAAIKHGEGMMRYGLPCQANPNQHCETADAKAHRITLKKAQWNPTSRLILLQNRGTVDFVM